jgi:ubiquinone/menaquinone biosynthesis C-methylase UbiE
MEAIMDVARQTYDEQATLWNGIAGRAWVDARELLDQMFQPLEDVLVEAVWAGRGGRVLDVGCGTGSTTLAVAQLLGAKGCCIGIDISDPMIAAARARAEREGVPVDFLRADAETHAFAPDRFDMIISRLGVMFFGDAVRAFANLRRTAKNDGQLRFIAWRSAEENPFMTTAERAAAPLLQSVPVRRPDAPGQFAFADQRWIKHILEASGWTDIAIRPIDLACSFPEPALVGYVTQLGPLGRVLHEADERTRAQVIDTVRAAFDPYVHGTEVRFTAACWMVGARASASTAPREAAHV